MLAPLEHEHIVRLYDYGEDGETPFLVMEFVDGASLGDVARGREFTWDQVSGDRLPIARRSPTRTRADRASRPHARQHADRERDGARRRLGLRARPDRPILHERDDAGDAARHAGVLVAEQARGRDSDTRDGHVRARLPALLAALGTDTLRGRRPSRGRAAARARGGSARLHRARSASRATPRCSSTLCSRPIRRTDRPRSRCSSGSAPRRRDRRGRRRHASSPPSDDSRLPRAARDGGARAADAHARGSDVAAAGWLSSRPGSWPPAASPSWGDDRERRPRRRGSTGHGDDRVAGSRRARRGRPRRPGGRAADRRGPGLLRVRRRGPRDRADTAAGRTRRADGPRPRRPCQPGHGRRVVPDVEGATRKEAVAALGGTGFAASSARRSPGRCPKGGSSRATSPPATRPDGPDRSGSSSRAGPARPGARCARGGGRRRGRTAGRQLRDGRRRGRLRDRRSRAPCCDSRPSPAPARCSARP